MSLSMVDTLVRGGTLVTDDGAVEADLWVGPGVIEGVVPWGTTVQARRVIDADGLLVLPGAVDVHTHLEAPSHGIPTSDTFETGTIAALHGGTTTIVDFAVQLPGAALRDSVVSWVDARAGRSAVDFGCHLIVTQVDDESLAELSDVAACGVTSVKAFMAYPHLRIPDDDLLRLMRQAAAVHMLPMVHAENGLIADLLAAESIRTGARDVVHFAATRPAAIEGEAIMRAAKIAELAPSPVFIVHVSSADGVDAIRRARADGITIHGETCPQYLYLAVEDAEVPAEVLKQMCCPPVRERRHQEPLWSALADGTLDIVSTDHSPFHLETRREHSADGFERTPMGIPGIEHRVDLVHTRVRDDPRFDLTDLVRMTASEPARLFGLYPRKGALLPGSDADVVLYDPDGSHTITRETHHMNVDYSAFEGVRVQGQAVSVLQRGVVVIEDGEFVGVPGVGRFLARGTSSLFVRPSAPSGP